MLRNQTDLHNLEDFAQGSCEDNLQATHQENTFLFRKTSTKKIERLKQQNQGLQQALRKADTKLKETQTQLTQAGKLATLGTLGSEIAHELNNPLTVVCAEADEIIEGIGSGSFGRS